MSDAMAPPPEHPKLYTCGTLKYTLPKLVLVFFWLMLGGMVYVVCMQLPGRMLPVQLTLLGTTDLEKMVILTTIGGVLNMTVCPYVGFVSDRYRSRWGRRIPYILFSLPFLVLSLLLFAFTDRIGPWIAHAVSGIAEVAPATMTVIVIAMVMVMFQFYNMYVGSVFWYIFNDVIPEQFFGRVMGAFQIASNTGVSLFSIFVFGYARSHFSLIFIVGAVAYAAGMILMCVMVKEGEYPPIEGEAGRNAGGALARAISGFRIFVRESLSHRFYLMRYGVTSLVALTGVAGAFAYNFNLEMGLNESMIGRMDGGNQMALAVATVTITVFASVLIDRWHPMRIYAYNTVFMLAGSLLALKWLFGVLPPGGFVLVAVAGTVSSVFLGTINGIAGLPMEMLTFPKSRFGSFCSAQALLRSTATTLIGLAAGGIFDLLRGLCTPFGETYHYRFVQAWPIPWCFLAMVLVYFTYREWGRLGGYRNYAAPAIWRPDGREPVRQPVTRNPSAALLRLALKGFDLLVALSAAVGLFAVWQAGRAGQAGLAGEFLLCSLPALALLGGVWVWVRRGISRDLRRCLARECPRNGIPHHGLLLLVLINYLAQTILTAYQITLLMDRSAIAFLLAQYLSTLALLFSIALICRMERGIVTEVAEQSPPRIHEPAGEAVQSRIRARIPSRSRIP